MAPKSVKPTLVIAEDDADLAAQMRDALIQHGFSTIVVPDWNNLMLTLGRVNPDLLLLDQFLGPVDTITRLADIRKVTDASITFLTGNRDEIDRVLALELGAEDFLSKPISVRELVARLKVRYRNRPERAMADPGSAEGGWRLNMELVALQSGSRQIKLTGAEFSFLKILAEGKGTPVSRPDLTTALFKSPQISSDRSVDNLVYNLRRKLVAAGAEYLINTTRLQGYSTSLKPPRSFEERAPIGGASRTVKPPE